MPVDKTDPTVGTPKKSARASVNRAAVASPVRVTRQSVASLADNVQTVGTPKKRARANVNPAAVASPVRVTRRSVAALTEEVPAVSSPKRKSRASINPSVIACPARVTHYSIAVTATEEALETQPVRSPTKSRRKSTLPKGKSEAHDETEMQKGNSASIPKIEESPESRPYSTETPDQIDTDTKPFQLPAADGTTETNISTVTSRNTPPGSANGGTPGTKIPTRSNRNTPPGSGNIAFRTPTQSEGDSRPSTPVSRNISDSSLPHLISAKSSTDRHATRNCNSRDSSPICTSSELRRNYFSSPVRHSPQSSPSRQQHLSFGESRDASPKPSAKTKPTSPLVSGKSALPSQPNGDRSARSSPLVRNATKGKETSVPEKHCLEDEYDSIVMPNKRIKRATADGEAGPSSNVESLQEYHSPKKKLSDSSKPEQKEKVSDDSLRFELKEENTEHTSTVSDCVGVDGADSEEETEPNASLSIPRIQKLSYAKTSSSNVKVDEEIDRLENTTLSDEASLSKQTPPAKDEGSGKPGEVPSTEASQENVKGVVRYKEEEKSLSPVLENDSPSASGASLVDEPKEVVENRVGNEIAPSSREEPQVLEMKVNDNRPQKATESEVKNCEHQEFEQSVIINDSDETGGMEGRNPDQDEIVGSAESPVSEKRSDVPKANTPTTKESIVTPVKCESEEGIISDKVETVVNSESPVSENSPDASTGKALNIKESLDVSPVKCESEKGRISDLGEAVVNAKSPAKEGSSYVPRGETPTIKESLEVSPAKSDALLNSASEKSTIEHIPVEGYKETSDSGYHSSVVGPSDKDIEVPSIMEGLGINDMKQGISDTVKLASQAETGKVTSSSDRTLENIIEDDEYVSENGSVPKSKVDTRESKLSVSDTAGDQLVSSSETNAVETTIDERGNTDQSSFASLRLAVSPEPPGSVEDDSPPKDEMGSSAMQSTSKDLEKQTSESLSVEDSEENIDTPTVSGMLGLKKCAVTSGTKTVSGEEKIEQNGGPEIYENDTASVGDSDEDTGDVNGPLKGSDFIDDEAEEVEETDEESENDENVYDATEESVSTDSDVGIVVHSFIIDEVKESKSCEEKPSSDSVGEDNGTEDGPDAEDVERSGKVVDFDDSCYIAENSDDDENPLKSEDTPKNATPESEISPKAGKPLFKVTELDTDGTTVNETQEFASGAASHFVAESKKSVKIGEPLPKSILKSLKALRNEKAYVSTAASQFVVSEIASKDKQKKKQPKVVKRNDVSTVSHQNSDSSFTSSDQEQENTKRIPKTKKRPAAKAEALREKEMYKNDTNAPGFCVKLCNIAPRTSIDELKKALEEFGIVTGLLSLGFSPKLEKRKKTAIAAYDSKKNLQRALAGYGKVTVHDRQIFFLLDDETTSISDDQLEPQAASPKKSPIKKFFGIISDLPKDITIGDIIGAYEQKGIKYINKVKIYKWSSNKDNLNFAKLEFSRKSALLKAIILTEDIRIRGNKISLEVKEKPSIP